MNRQNLKIAIVKSEFNQQIIEKMEAGAKEAACEEKISLDQIETYTVPGAFELPLIAKKLAKTQAYDAVICLGAVLKGETAHFDYVSMGVTMGIIQASLDTEVPILFGILTCDFKQALVRSQGDRNKGYHTFKAAISMIDTCVEIKNKNPTESIF